MKLKVVSPTQYREYTIVWLELTTPVGGFIIQLGHAPCVFSLKRNQPVTFCLKNGKQESLMIDHGIAEISRTGVVLAVRTEQLLE